MRSKSSCRPPAAPSARPPSLPPSFASFYRGPSNDRRQQRVNAPQRKQQRRPPCATPTLSRNEQSVFWLARSFVRSVALAAHRNGFAADAAAVDAAALFVLPLVRPLQQSTHTYLCALHSAVYLCTMHFLSRFAFAHSLKYRGRARASVPLFLSSLIPPFLPRARAYNVLYSICDLYHSFVFPISSARNVLLPFAGGFKEDSKSFHSNSLCPFFYPSTLISDDFFLF